LNYSMRRLNWLNLLLKAGLKATTRFDEIVKSFGMHFVVLQNNLVIDMLS